MKKNWQTLALIIVLSLSLQGCATRAGTAVLAGGIGAAIAIIALH